MRKLIAIVAAAAAIGHAHAQDISFRSGGFEKIEVQGHKCTGFFNTPSSRCDPLSVPAYLKRASDRRALVVISHGSQGLDRRHSDYADQLVANGISAVVVGHWEARGLGKIQDDYEKGRRAGGDSTNQVLDVLAVATHLGSQAEWSAAKFGHLGESMGGSTALNLTRPYLRRIFAQNHGREPIRLSGLVALYAGCTDRNTMETFLPTPIRFVHGADDDDTLASDCEKQVPWMNGRGGAASITILPNQVHDFDAPYRWARFRVQNPAKCANLRDGDIFILAANGKQYPATADGYSTMKKDCVGLSTPSVTSGHKASPRTGYTEWTEFFKQTLLDARPPAEAHNAGEPPVQGAPKTAEQIMKELNFK